MTATTEAPFVAASSTETHPDGHSMVLTMLGHGPLLYAWTCLCGEGGNGEGHPGWTFEDARKRARREHDQRYQPGVAT